MAQVGRPKKIQDAVETVSTISKEEQAISDKAILDANDSEKIQKDVMLLNIKELHNHREVLNGIIKDLTQDSESKRRILDGLNGSIAGAQSEIYNLKTNFEKQNVSLLAEFTKKQSDVESADKTLQALIQKNRESEKLNTMEASRLEDHRNICNSQVFEMKKALEQNQTEWNKREADILLREEALKTERASFEAEKESLVPEAAKITSTKNENILLLQKIDMQKLDIENMRRAMASDKERLEQQALINQVQLKKAQDTLVNEEARLRKWEQDIKDYDLETRARSAQADKVLKREQLQREVDSVKK